MSLQHSSEDKIEVIRTKPGQPLGCSIIDENGREIEITEAVSYTHLTLPTICSV